MWYILLLISFIFPICEDVYLGDINSDDDLNILDIVATISFVLDDNNQPDDFIEISDINSDGTVNILDLVRLVNKVLHPNPPEIFINQLGYDLNNLTVSWSSITESDFYSYSILWSLDTDTEAQTLYTTFNQSDTLVSIVNNDLSFNNYISIRYDDIWGCYSISSSEDIEKDYFLDEFGHVIDGNMSIDDFKSAQNCITCHAQHYSEWETSMHAFSMKSPLFFSSWQEEQFKHPETGERFCAQCHIPTSFVTGYDISGFNSPDEFQNSDLSDVVKEAVTCTFCHSVTGVSKTYVADDNLNAHAEYHLYPGEDVMFGSIVNPQDNFFHESRYLPLYSQSEMCLPCHDFVMRDVEAEITFTEWNRIPEFAMSGAFPCQSCHMTVQPDGHHDHSFTGVDVDLTYSYGTSPQHPKVQSLLETAADLEFGAASYTLPESITAGEILEIPLTITSLTGHNLPSGTGFNREVWLETIVLNGIDTVFQSGVISNNYAPLNRQDPDLLLFTYYLLDQNGDTTYSITETYDFINESLGGLAYRYKLYEIEIPQDISGQLDISINMYFRPFRPEILALTNPELVENLPVFNMNSITATVMVE